MTFILPLRGSLTRRVIGGPDGYTVHDDIAANQFPCNVVEGHGDLMPTEVSPREMSYDTLHLPSRTLTPEQVPTSSGDRVLINADLYELLGRGRKLRTGRLTSGVAYAVKRVEDLYPLQALLSEKQGETIREDVILAMWAPAEDANQRGDYVTYEAEAPIEFAEDLTVNRWFLIRGQRFHIVRVTIPVNGPRVVMTIRKSKNSG